MYLKILSGGDTGVARSAMDVAIGLCLPLSGWCPRGRRAEDGVIPEPYALYLDETPTGNYRQRTAWNVRDAAAVLALCRGRPTGGTRLTIDLARKAGCPHHLVDLATWCDKDAAGVAGWLWKLSPASLLVAGPRESKQPGVGGQARRFLRLAFRHLMEMEG